MAKKSDSTSGTSMDEGRKAMLDKAVGDIVKRYGDGSIMRLGDAHKMTIDAIPTGSLSLDLALGIGGIPRGRITEIYGPEFIRENHALPAYRCRSAKTRRDCRLCRYGACPRPDLCGEMRGGRG